MLSQYDMISWCTWCIANPPFSLGSKLVKLLRDNNKHYILLGYAMSCGSYKLQGSFHSCGGVEFDSPAGGTKCVPVLIYSDLPFLRNDPVPLRSRYQYDIREVSSFIECPIKRFFNEHGITQVRYSDHSCTLCEELPVGDYAVVPSSDLNGIPEGYEYIRYKGKVPAYKVDSGKYTRIIVHRYK